MANWKTNNATLACKKWTKFAAEYSKRVEDINIIILSSTIVILEMYVHRRFIQLYKIVKRAFLLAVNSIIQTSPELIIKS